MKSSSKRFSKAVLSIGEATSVKVNMQVYDLQRQGKDVIILSLGEAFFNIPLKSFRAIPEIEKGYHYSSSLGIPDLRDKISAYYSDRYGVRSTSGEVLISAGSKVVIYLALKALLNPGDEVIIFEPAWVSYTEQVRLCDGVPKTIPYDEGIADLKKYVSKKTRVIILNNPNNPSGKVYSKKELQALCAFAKKHNLWIISDEAYSDFVHDEPFVSLGVVDARKERVIIVNSLSKNMGMSGWRLGYAIAHRDLIYQLLKLNQHLVTCPATILEQYVSFYFDDILAVTDPQIKAVVEKRTIVAKYIKEIGLEVLSGTGTFYFMLSLGSSRLKSSVFAESLLKKHGVAVVPGIGYGDSLNRFVRIGVGTESLTRIKKALTLIHQHIAETS